MKPDFNTTITVFDTHYGGDVSRIILDGVGRIPGDSLLEQMNYLRTDADGLRQLLIYEPHGNPSMCVVLLVPPCTPEADAGYIIMEAMGYPPFSGSNTVCTVTALLESGRLPMREGTQRLQLECAEGLVNITAECRGSRVRSITCEGQPAFVVERDRTIWMPDRGQVRYDLVWSGCFYAVVDAEALGFQLVPEEKSLLETFGSTFIDAVNPALDLVHPRLGSMGPLAFLHFAGPVEQSSSGPHRTRSVTYVHPRVICRCPTGTGTAARLAVLGTEGILGEGEQLQTESLTGSKFTGTVVRRERVGSYEGVQTSLTGRAWTLARSELVVDFSDPMISADGFSDLLTRR